MVVRQRDRVRLVALMPSDRPGKKLKAVFVTGHGTLTRHFGAEGHGDYVMYYEASPTVAREKRRQYIARHGKGGETWDDPTTPGALSRYLLWEKPTLKQAVAAFKKRFGV